jgi:hypothetical protein
MVHKTGKRMFHTTTFLVTREVRGGWVSVLAEGICSSMCMYVYVCVCVVLAVKTSTWCILTFELPIGADSTSVLNPLDQSAYSKV